MRMRKHIIPTSITRQSHLFWEIQKLLWQSFHLPLRILLVFFFLLTHQLMFENFTTMEHVSSITLGSSKGSSTGIPLRTEEGMNLF